MNQKKGLQILLEYRLGLDQCFLPPHHLSVLQLVVHENDDERRLQFLRANLTWSAILAIAVGITVREKAALLAQGDAEAAFRTGGLSPVTNYFLDRPQVMRHWLIAHNLYWTLFPRRVNEQLILPVSVMQFFHPDEGDYFGTIGCILDYIPPASQPFAFAAVVGLYRFYGEEFDKHYKTGTDLYVLAQWTRSHEPMCQQWEFESTSHWNLSRIWWETALAYVNAMDAQYDIRMDFRQHSLRGAFPDREIVAILSLGRRQIHYTAEDVQTEEMVGQSTFGHCATWMMGTSRAEYAEPILKMQRPTNVIYRELLRILFFRRCRIQAQWDAAASRGLLPWAEGRSCGRMVYLAKKK